MPHNDLDLRWGVRRRLEFIDFRLFWEEYINRSALVDQFGISVPQASSDLSRYMELAPGNIEYDKSSKRYVASNTFQPALISPDSETYLGQLSSSSEEPTHGIWIGAPPPRATVEIPQRRIDPELLRRVLRSIRQNMRVEVLYQSFSRPEPIWRWISPHALGFDSFRWHARSYCHLDDKFKDFLLSRILGARGEQDSDVEPATDLSWEQVIRLTLSLNPKLKAGQKRALELEYGMLEGQVQVCVRAAFEYYVKRHFHLDDTTIATEDRWFVLDKREEVASDAVAEAAD